MELRMNVSTNVHVYDADAMVVHAMEWPERDGITVFASTDFVLAGRHREVRRLLQNMLAAVEQTQCKSEVTAHFSRLADQAAGERGQ